MLCIALSVGLALPYWALAVQRLGEDASENATANFDDREFGGGNSLVVDKGALYEARALIPEDGVYRVATGPRVEGATELTEPYIDQFARSFLMPRRQSPDASWVLCYGCDHADLEGSFEVVWENGAGISLGRLER